MSVGKTGEIKLILKGDVAIPEFKITNGNHFIRLLKRNNNILKVECKDNSFKNFLEDLLSRFSIEKIARENQFEPQIEALKNIDTLEIKSRYHLAFRDKKKVLKPLILF